jgi:hypothetical protein
MSQLNGIFSRVITENLSAMLFTQLTKKKLQQSALQENSITSLDDYIAVIKKIKNTDIVLKVKTRSNNGHDCTRFTKGIRCYHQYIFRPETENIECKILSNQGVPIYQSVHQLHSSQGEKSSEDLEENGVEELSDLFDVPPIDSIIGLDEFDDVCLVLNEYDSSL